MKKNLLPLDASASSDLRSDASYGKKNSGRIQTEIETWVMKNGAQIAMKIGGKEGTPDLMIIVDSTVLFVEVKSGGDRERPLQKVFRRKANTRREISFVCYSLEEFKAVYETFLTSCAVCASTKESR